MNQKEVAELRRRFRLDKSAISRIYGCYVNGSSKEIISDLDEPLSLMPAEEAEKYLNLLKKALSGVLGRNLLDIVFSTEQVADSPEHRLLTALRSSGLKDGEARRTFYQTVIERLEMGEGNYLILLAHDAYDVPRRGRDGEADPDGSDADFSYILCSVCPVKNCKMELGYLPGEDASDEVFQYILCCVCPVKGCKMELGYFPGENEFHSCAAGQVVSPPELGFLFPAFDNRAANIYNALFYSRNADQLHQEFIDAVFHTEPPMSAAEQKEAFENALSGALEDECLMDVVQSVHEQLREKIEQHKESRDPEPLAVTARDVGGILQTCGIAQERLDAFQVRCDEYFGENAALNPSNLIDSKRFEVKTPEITITISPECSYLVETCVIDGRKYLLIPAGEGVEINGLAVGLRDGREKQMESGSI